MHLRSLFHLSHCSRLPYYCLHNCSRFVAESCSSDEYVAAEVCRWRSQNSWRKVSQGGKVFRLVTVPKTRSNLSRIFDRKRDSDASSIQARIVFDNRCIGWHSDLAPIKHFLLAAGSCWTRRFGCPLLPKNSWTSFRYLNQEGRAVKKVQGIRIRYLFSYLKYPRFLVIL